MPSDRVVTTATRPNNASSRRRTLAVVIAAVLTLGVAEMAARSVIDRGDWGLIPLAEKVQQMETLGTADVVFIGDSTILVGIDPDLFVAASDSYDSAYNAGMQGGSPRLWHLWFTEAVLPGLTPDVAVLGLTPMSLNDAGQLHPARLARYESSLSRRSAVGALGPIERVRHGLTLTRNGRDLRSPATWFGGVGVLTSAGRDTTTSTLAYSIPSAFTERMVHEVMINFTIGGRELGDLGSFAAAVRATGTTIVFVLPPFVDDDFWALAPQGSIDRRRFERAVIDRAEEMGVVLLIPPADEYSESMFADPVHLNDAGVTRFSTWLAGELSALGLGQ